MEDIEDTDYVASEHDRLVSAITKLDKTQHITEPTRNEPTNLNSEFNLIKKSNQFNLNNVAKILENTSHHVKISKKLKKTSQESKVLSKPLEKPQAERIKRATGYDDTKKRVGRWDPVVARNRTVDYVSFPLKQASTKLQPTGEFLSKLKLKSDLEKELDELEPPVVEENDEVEEQVYPMSYEEMVAHRQNMAKLRAQQSYKAAKAKRQSKIKSKKYHRVLRKERLKKQLHEFEELQKNDPEEALRKLEILEKDRALERHTLRHKSTGKWAKNKLIRAKYDKEVRQELADQLAVSRSLTQKVQNVDSSDDEPDTQIIPDLNLVQDPMNPWGTKTVNSEFDFGYKKFVQNRNKIVDSDSDSDDKNTEDKDNNEPTVKVDSITEPKPSIHLKKVTLKKVRPIATSNWVVESVIDIETNVVDEISTAFESHESTLEKQVEKKLKEIRWNIEKIEIASRLENKKSKVKSKDTKEKDNLEYLGFKPKNAKAVIDEELIETSSRKVSNEVDSEPLSKVLNGTQQPAQESAVSNIDPIGFTEMKRTYLNTALSKIPQQYDQLDDDDEQVVPKVNMEDVYEEDDVVDSFRREKQDEINKDKPEEEKTLPGWGAWGGKGVKPQKRKRNRFIGKLPPRMPRRDDNKGDIIIREHKDPKLAIHKVKDVPFPFESVKDYEASIRAPLGNTFIPEKAHKKLIRPSVITKAGTIIDPMDEEELLVAKNQNYKNKSVLKLLGRK